MKQKKIKSKGKLFTLKAQVISLDLMLAIMIFVVIISLFFIFFSSRLEEVPEVEVKREAIVFKNMVAVNNKEEETPVTLIVQNKLDYNKLVNLADEINKTPKSYDDIKSKLDIKSDFCIFFQDQNGNILPLILPDDGSGKVRVVYGIGNPNLDFKLNDTIVCGKVYELS